MSAPPVSAAAAAQQAAEAAARTGTVAQQDAAVRTVVGSMLPGEQVGWRPQDDETGEVEGEDEEGAYSDDDVPVCDTSGGAGAAAVATTPGKAVAAVAAVAGAEARGRRVGSSDAADILVDLDWMFTITKEARQSWALLPRWARWGDVDGMPLALLFWCIASSRASECPLFMVMYMPCDAGSHLLAAAQSTVACTLPGSSCEDCPGKCIRTPPHSMRACRDLVIDRLRVIGQGAWPRAGGVKRITCDRDESLRGLVGV